MFSRGILGGGVDVVFSYFVREVVFISGGCRVGGMGVVYVLVCRVLVSLVVGREWRV